MGKGCPMRHVIIVLALVVASAISTGCAAKGIVVGGSLQKVVVTNNSTIPCQLYRDGEAVGVLSVGETARVGFRLSRRQMLLQCKVFEANGGSRPVYRGVAERMFSTGFYSHDVQSWIITHIQVSRRPY